MEVPCPVPLSKPWSPVGYQVIPMAEALPPAGESPPQVLLCEDPGRRSESRAIPRSPTGYRVVLLADEIVPPRAATPAAAPKARSIKLPTPTRKPLHHWMPFLAVASCLLIPTMSMALIFSGRSARQGAPLAQNVDVVIPPAMVVVPEAMRGDAPAEAQAQGAAPAQPVVQPLANPIRPANDDCAQCEAPAAPPAEQRDPRAGRDMFDTAVEFARNSQEAARLARDENKLTFLLHVAGNFEDPGFT